MRLLPALVVLLAFACDEAGAAEGPDVFLLTDSNGYVHDVVKPTDGDSLVKKTIQSIVEGRLRGRLVHSDDASKLTAEVLDPAKTRVVVMYTTGDLPMDLDLLNQYVENGGTLLGIHCATDTFKEDERFFGLIGGTFVEHPWNANTDVVLKSLEPEHPVVKPIGAERALKEEIYLHKNFDPAKVRVLNVLDMEKTELKRPEMVPVVWVREVGKGRILYTSLGHNAAVWESDWYQSHLENGFKWLLREVEGPAEPNPDMSRRETEAAEAAGANADAGGEAMFVAMQDPAAPPTTGPTTGATTRPHDPWVFRCVLDGRPRVVVAALGPELWVAYDATTCGLYKAWNGGMEFTGSVYDTKHGPQPQTRGTVLSQHDGQSFWQVLKDEAPVEASARFSGYRLSGADSVQLSYRVTLPEGEVTISETPEVVEGNLRRVFEVKGLPAGYALQFPLGIGMEVARATHVSPDARMVIGPDQTPFLRIDKDGPAHVITRWERTAQTAEQPQSQPAQPSAQAQSPAAAG